MTSERLLAASRIESEDKITNARTALVREFDDVKLALASPQDYIVRIANFVGASYDVLRRAQRLLEVYQREEGNYRGTSPRVTAAVSLHASFDQLSVEDRPTLEEFGRAADVDPTTISKRKSSFVSVVDC
ncbi:cyclin family protein [Natrinema hispanicum]|uniref:cyclin family protein n=1 Tax=Natrinema hispanicum TaxID=392421 RepID=UPI001F5F9A6A|nr:cyclin family protein [Natrinema hispanicum]